MSEDDNVVLIEIDCNERIKQILIYLIFVLHDASLAPEQPPLKFVMSQEKTNEKERETLMESLIIEDTIQKENIPFYQYAEFENVKLISRNVYKAIFKTSQEIVALKCVYLNDDFTLDNLISEIKRHRKFEIHDCILKFYGITRQKNTKNYMIILEYVNEGSLRQYLKTNFQKMDWNAKLNLAKQIANVLMFLHSNDIIHGRLNSKNILIHNGNIKLNDLGSIDSLRFLTNNFDTIQYMDPQHLELSTIGKDKSSDIFKLGIILCEISNGNPPFEMESLSNIDFLNNIVKGKREMTISGTPQKYEEIYTDCWKHNENSRPNISQIVKNLSEIIISDASVEATHSNLYDVTDEIISVRFEKSNKNSELKLDPPLIDASVEAVVFIKDVFEFFIDIPAKQGTYLQPILFKNYIRKQKKNPAKILYEMIRYPSHCWFTSLIGFFYQHGIGTVVDNQMAFKFFNLAAANEIIDMNNIASNLLIRKFYKVNKEMGHIYLAKMYLDGIGIEKDLKKGFQIYSKVADEGSHIALNCMACCYENGHGVEKSKKKALKLYLKSAEKGNLVAQSNVGICCENGIGIAIDETKAFQCFKKSASAGNFNSMCNVGYSYECGIGVGEDEKEAFEWYLKAAEKGSPKTQYNVGNCYKHGCCGINRDEIYSKVADEGSHIALNCMACCYENGHGVEKSKKKALKLYLKSAEKGNLVAQSNVGICCENGIGIAIDETKAFQCFKKSASAGNFNSMCNVGYSYECGIGVGEDEKEAFEWYLKAAEKGSPKTQYNVGNCYKHGCCGINRDEVKAFKWYKKAAENDHADSQYMIGKCFYEGCGIKKDIVNAIHWLNKAKENGNTYANELLEEIISNIM
ncbi:hypothetical protein Glove_275g54 [Diversispora epigaea]|uniref:Protein kinase domain-containing protein n=1 Tax=Diversispora epigaea TaxID=1348612 RepID=A0A397I8G0_9GLOM|nr:hypothetical protein Glove_275g54 [Diversispora epigaea]